MRISGLGRIAAGALLASLTGGCMLHSKMPLIAQSDSPAGIEGTYQVTGAMDAATRRKLPKAERAKCLDPGYVGQIMRIEQAPKGRKAGPVRVFYCGYDPDDKKPLPRTAITRSGASYRWSSTDENKNTELRFKTLHPELLLGQFEQGDKAEPRFDYLMMRTRAGDVEVFPLFCPDFPHAPTKPVELFKPLQPPDAEAPPQVQDPTVSECEIDSFAPIQGDLDAYVARVDAGEIVPLIILHRVP